MARPLTELIAEVFGHTVELHRRKVNGTTTHYWIVCSCGYETEPGPSYRRHLGSAIGHVKRVGKRLNEEITSETPFSAPARHPAGGVSLPGSVGGRA